MDFFAVSVYFYEKQRKNMRDQAVLLSAVGAFEKQFGCRLCLHDYTGHLPKDVLPTYHLNPFCTGLKKSNPRLDPVCYSFDRNNVQDVLAKDPRPFLKHCPCGMTEAVFAVLLEHRLLGCVFAGPYAPADMGTVALSAPKLFQRPRNAARLPPVPKALDAFYAYGELISLEIARRAFLNPVLPSTEKETVQAFLDTDFSRNKGLDDIAAILSLSPARASERIHKLFGKGFTALLRERRLEAAKQLLRYSCFTIETVALRCGFRSGEYFHRVFHRECGMSPKEYRTAHAPPEV